MTEGLGSISVEPWQDEATLSPEDIAWADSCLTKDPEMLASGWNSLRAALLDTVDAQNHSSLYERDYSLEEDKMEIFPSENMGDIRNVEEINVFSNAARYVGTDTDWNSSEYAVLESLSTQYQSSPYDRNKSLLEYQSPVKENYPNEDINDVYGSDKTPVSIASTSEGPELNTEDHLNHGKAADFWSRHKTEDVFLPTYDENLRDIGVSDLEVDLVFQEFQVEQPTEDIFKIWEIDIPAEENDLMKQMNKALAENPLEPTIPTVSDDSEAWKSLQDESLDRLISGIADLTLSPNSD